MGTKVNYVVDTAGFSDAISFLNRVYPTLPGGVSFVATKEDGNFKHVFLIAKINDRYGYAKETDYYTQTEYARTESGGWVGNIGFAVGGTIDNPVPGLSIIKSTNGFTICRKDEDYAAQLQLNWWDGLRIRVKTGSDWGVWESK